MTADTQPLPSANDDRWLKARVEMVVATLPMTMVLNPIWSALTMIPLGGAFPAFGVVPSGVLFAIIGLHMFNSLLAGAVYLWHGRANPKPRLALAALLVLQVWISVSWGVGCVACWVEGNPTNNTFIALLIIGMTWALAITRSVHPLLFTAGILPLVAIFWVRSLVGAGESALVFSLFTPVFISYAWFMAMSACDRVNQVLRARFKLEDMAKALDAARNDAIAKTLEAEAASASKSAFVANMSHELRTPLNAILGFAELIENQSVGGDVPPSYRNYARDIRESGAHLLSLVNDMLDVAKIEAGKMEIDRQRLDTAEAIDAAVRLVAQRAEIKRQTIELRIDPAAHLFADERAFKQILLNLLSNAVKFSPEGSAVAVACVRAADGAARVTVEDRGPGIPPDKINQLFRPFSRVDNRYDSNAGGTGLGLALVRGLVALHDGKVWLENKPEGGLLAAVELPPQTRTARAA